MLYDALPKPFFVLAPMDDVTDTVFRRLVAECARPDMFFTEFVSVDGLQSVGRERLLKRIQFTDVETPLVAQIWGKSPENYYKTARELVEMGFAGIDINMGCPEKTVVKNGCCSALILNRPLALEIIQATKEGAAGKIPVSVKTRLGFNEVDLSWHELLLGQDLAALTVHGRTRKQMSLVPADWEKVAEVRELRDRLATNTKIIGNGDVMSRRQGQELAEKYRIDGIMIGRGIFQDPFAFAEDGPWAEYSKERRIDLYRQHVELFADTWRNGKVYVNGFDCAKELRERLMAARSTQELLAILYRA
jgi:tRNA-dihydrouridine synthase